jgi:hypothetical protein
MEGVGSEDDELMWMHASDPMAGLVPDGVYTKLLRAKSTTWLARRLDLSYYCVGSVRYDKIADGDGPVDTAETAIDRRCLKAVG